jgi:hypothetical protein
VLGSWSSGRGHRRQRRTQRLASGDTRANPVVAIGGSGPFIAFAWEDQTASPPGIYARRFPLPP